MAKQFPREVPVFNHASLHLDTSATSGYEHVIKEEKRVKLYEKRASTTSALKAFTPEIP